MLRFILMLIVLSLIKMAVKTGLHKLIYFLLQGNSSTDSGQLLLGIWGSTRHHPSYKQGRQRTLTKCFINHWLIISCHLIDDVCFCLDPRLTLKMLTQREWKSRLRRSLTFQRRNALGWVCFDQTFKSIFVCPPSLLTPLVWVALLLSIDLCQAGH